MKDKDKEKAKDSDKEKERSSKLKKKSHSKKLKSVSKRSAKIEDDEPDTGAKSVEADDEPADITPDEDAEAGEEEIEAEEEAPPQPKSAKGRRGAKSGADAEKNGGEPGKPLSRLGLIRARHESMKREIEQIREDLDSDEEE